MQVNDLDSSDSSMARATSLGCLQYPPSVYLANAGPTDRLSSTAELPLMSLPLLYLPSFARDDSRTDLTVGNLPVASSSTQVESSAPVQFQIEANATEQYDPMVPSIEDSLANCYPNGTQSSACDMVVDATETTEVQLVEGYPPSSSANADSSGSIPSHPDRVSLEHRQRQILPSRDPTSWELPFLQGWLMGQSQAGMSSTLPHRGAPHEYSSAYLGIGPSILTSDSDMCNGEVPVASLERSGVLDNSLHPPLTSASGYGQGATSTNNLNDRAQSVPIISRIQSELAASLAATAAAELPCTVKLRIWPHDLKTPCASLNSEKCRLTIPHAVLCRYCLYFLDCKSINFVHVNNTL